MIVDYIDRSSDEEIINLVRSIMDNGSFVVETFNESILASLMAKRGTPFISYVTHRNIKDDLKRWVNNNEN